MTNLVTKKTELENTFVTIVGDMEQQKKVAATATSPPPIDNKLDMKKVVCSIPSWIKISRNTKCTFHKFNREETSGST